MATSDDRSFTVSQSNSDQETSSAVSGDLQVKGPNVFRGYHGRPEATAKEFDGDSWFRTGDTAEIDPSDGSFKILGRTSVDIIK